MGCGVGVPTHNRHSRLGDALLGPDHMHNPLAGIGHVEFCNTKFRAISIECLDLQFSDGIINPRATIRGRHIMISHGQISRQASRRSFRIAQASKGLGGGHLVQKLSININ